MAVESYHDDFMRKAIGEAEAFPAPRTFSTSSASPRIDLADDCSTAMMTTWHSNPANERLWQGDIGN
ncbi:hypothetical protein Q3C01_37265 [Bradyrhizobium sp. UFLA05-109]